MNHFLVKIVRPFKFTYIPQHNRTLYGVAFRKYEPSVDEIMEQHKTDIKWVLVFYFGNRFRALSNYFLHL